MAAMIFNTGKGAIAQYTRLADTTSDQLTWVLFSAIESDTTLKGRATLAAMTSNGSTEATFTGYAKLDAVGFTYAPAAPTLVDITTDPSWSPTSAQALVAIVLFYAPAGSYTASGMIPLFKDDFALTTPTSGTITYTVASGGFYSAT